MLRRFQWSLLAIAIVPIAAASGAIDTPVARVVVENGHDSDCIEDASGLCLAAARGEGVTQIEIDIEQQFRWVVIELNGSLANELLGLELLPDGALTLNASHAYLPHPVFRFWAKNLGQTRAPAPLDGFGILIDEQGYGFAYVGPRMGEFPPRIEEQAFHPQYSSQGGIEYERVGPTNDLHNASTDEQVDAMMHNPCFLTQNEACHSHAAQVSEQYRASAPNVRLGFEFVEAGVGTRVRTFDESSGVGTRAGPAALGPRAPLTMPAGTLNGPMGALPLQSGPQGPEVGPLPGRGSSPPRAAQEAATRVDGPAGPAPVEFTPLLAALATSLALAVLLTALYTRITKANATSSDARAKILAMLQEGPQRVTTLAERLQVDRSTVDHHVRVLSRTGFVTFTRVGRAALVALPKHAVPAQGAAGRTHELILQALAANGGSLPRDALHAAVPDAPLRTRNAAIMTLARRGLVRREWNGRMEIVRLATGAGA